MFYELITFVKQSKTKQNPEGINPAQTSGKFMMILLPVMLAVFALTYNAVFAIYLLVSQLITLASTPIIDVVLDKLEQRQENKKLASATVEYSRNNSIIYQETKTESDDKPNKKTKQKQTNNDNQNQPQPQENVVEKEKTVKNVSNKKKSNKKKSNKNNQKKNLTNKSVKD